MRTKVAFLAGSVLLVTLTACGGDAGPGEAPTPSTAESVAAAPSSPSASALSAAPTDPATPQPTFDIAYISGKVTGVSGRLKVKTGAKVTIRVTSDVADEVHLHGYDVSVKVPAGGSALLSFTARMPGVYALEMERLGKELGKVQVQ